MTALAGHLGIHVNVHLILNRQLDQLLTRILPHLDQGRMIRATRTEGLRGIDGVLDSSARQMRWKTATAVRASFAFLLLDRKSTRLNSSHLGISYAVFCLKKKKTTHNAAYAAM